MVRNERCGCVAQPSAQGVHESVKWQSNLLYNEIDPAGEFPLKGLSSSNVLHPIENSFKPSTFVQDAGADVLDTITE
ncbi:hypothetical protein HGRIS_004279 [Hohenbuehelia grisea]|uniref:Uncharacterized protein n=1 Tax=Hohenbuehelia grisea TaxID=104357 RepID=A0ABR3IPA8_9AGAR